MSPATFVFVNNLAHIASGRSKELQQADARAHAARISHQRVKHQARQRKNPPSYEDTPLKTSRSTSLLDFSPQKPSVSVRELFLTQIRQPSSEVISHETNGFAFSSTSSWSTPDRADDFASEYETGSRPISRVGSQNAWNCDYKHSPKPKGNTALERRFDGALMKYMADAVTRSSPHLIYGNAVGNGNRDPFDSFVISMNSEMQMLLRFYTLVIGARSINMNDPDDHMRQKMGLQSVHRESGLSVMLLTAKLVYDAQKAHPKRSVGVDLVRTSLSVLQYKEAALEAISRDLRQVTHSTFALLMYAIDILLVFESACGNLKSVFMHLQSLKKWMDTEDLWSYLPRVIHRDLSSFSNKAAASCGLTPVFPPVALDNNPSNVFLDLVVHHPLATLASVVKERQSLELPLRPELAATWTSLRRLTIFHEIRSKHPTQLKSSDHGYFKLLGLEIEYRLLKASCDARTIPGSWDMLDAACIQASMLYFNLVLFFNSALSEMNTKPRSRLFDLTDRIDIHQLLSIDAERLLWVLFIGAICSMETDSIYDSLVRRLAEVVATSDLTWSDLPDILDKYFYLGECMDKHFVQICQDAMDILDTQLERRSAVTRAWQPRSGKAADRAWFMSKLSQPDKRQE